MRGVSPTRDASATDSIWDSPDQAAWFNHLARRTRIVMFDKRGTGLSRHALSPSSHDATVRREVARFRGSEVKSLGDGFLILFDGPARAIHCAEAIT